MMLRALAASLCLAGCAASGASTNIASTRAPELEQIADGVFVHKSWKNVEPWGLVLSQGLVIDMPGGVMLVDTAWNDADTAAIVDAIEFRTGDTPGMALVTHAHEDKMGGVAALKAAGVETRAHVYSNEDAPARGLSPAAAALFANEDLVYFGGVDPQRDASAQPERIVAFYPGAGHTRDNIVVYAPSVKVLFGGCLIRPAGSTNLGNTADADVANWANAVRRVAAQFPDAEIIVPSHGAAGGRELLDHTIALAEAANAESE